MITAQRAYGTRLTILLAAGVNDIMFGAADLAGTGRRWTTGWSIAPAG
jgi:hypothetical protein